MLSTAAPPQMYRLLGGRGRGDHGGRGRGDHGGGTRVRLGVTLVVVSDVSSSWREGEG